MRPCPPIALNKFYDPIFEFLPAPGFIYYRNPIITTVFVAYIKECRRWLSRQPKDSKLLQPLIFSNRQK